MLLFDADAAGDTAVNRAVELFLTQPVEIAIASLPDGMDPDEYLIAHGAEAFDGVLKGAADALTFTWSRMVRQYRATDDLTGQERAVRSYLEVLNKARHGGAGGQLAVGVGAGPREPVDGDAGGRVEPPVQPAPAVRKLPPESPGPVAAGPAGPQSGPPAARQPWQPRKPYNPFRPGDDGYRSGGGGERSRKAVSAAAATGR